MTQSPVAGKCILLIIGGGIAAYKCLDLIRRLKERGAAVRTVLTRGGAEFVTPLSVSALSGEPVFSELFDLTAEAEMGHIRLSREADLLVVAPATADLMARMAGGRADDLAATVLLATDKPVLAAPAMNVRMWRHKATQRNLARLREDGIGMVGPNEGAMACNEYGPGRMAEPAEILAAIERMLDRSGAPLAGRRVVVSSGPTHEPIDPVRYIANRSSGKQGHAIAAAASRAGAEVVLVSGPVGLETPGGVTLVPVETAAEMLSAIRAALPADVLVMAAAVADWRVADRRPQKLKKRADAGPAPLALVDNPDILATIARASEGRPALVVGFAAETENLVDNARAKLAAKGADWIVANDVSPDRGVFGGDDNTVHIVDRDGTEALPRMSKTEVADALVARIAAFLGTAKRQAAE